MSKTIAACKFCGQMIAIDVVDESDMECLEKAWRKCVCTGANRAREIEDFDQRLHEVCNMPINGRKISPDAEAAIHEIAQSCIDFVFVGARVTVDDANTITLFDKDGKLCIKRSSKTQVNT